MRIILICSIVLALSACEERGASIPIDNSTGYRDGYLVQVKRAGDIEWNGQRLDDAEFERYLRQYAAIPEAAGRLWVEIEPESPAGRIAFVRVHVIKSGLCRQQRCVEGRWDATRPVAN